MTGLRRLGFLLLLLALPATASEERIIEASTRLASRPEDAALRLELAEAYLAGGRRLEAFASWRQVVNSARAGANEKRTASRRIAEIAIEEAKRYARFADTARADRWLKIARSTGAISIDRSDLPPPDPAVIAAMKRIEEAGADYAAAHEAFDAIKGPRPARAYALLAATAWRAGRTNEAERALAAAIAIDPATPEIDALRRRRAAERAKAAVERGDFAEAIKLFGEAGALEPDDRLLRARALLGQGDTPTALIELEKLAEAPNAPAAVQVRLAMLYVELKDDEKLLERFGYASAAIRDLPPARLEEIGRKRLAAGDTATASELLRQVLVRDPSRAEAWATMGRIRWAEGERAKAAINLREAVRRGARVDPLIFAEALLASNAATEADAIMLSVAGETSTSAAMIERLCELARTHGRSAVAANLDRTLLRRRGDPVQIARLDAAEAERRGDHRGALRLLLGIPNRDSSTERAVFRLALGLGDDTTALRSFQRRRELNDPPSPTDRLALARLRARRGADEDVIMLLEGVPATPEGLALFTAAKRRLAPPPTTTTTTVTPTTTTVTTTIIPEIALQPEARPETPPAPERAIPAVPILETAPTAAASPREVILANAVKAAAAGRQREARNFFEEARRLGELEADHLDIYGNLLLADGDLAGAIDVWDRLVTLRPASSALHTKLARARDRQGDAAGADRHYQKAMEETSESLELGLEWTRVMLARDEPERALALIDRLPRTRAAPERIYRLIAAKRIGAEDPIARDRIDLGDSNVPAAIRAEAALALGETGTARALLSAALAGDPRFLTALGRAYLTANEPAAATQAIRILRRSGETLQALRLEIRIELARKRFDEAIRLGLRAIAMAPSDPDLRLLAAEALWRRGRHGECMTILKPLLVTLPDGRMKARALAGYGAAALALGLPQEAATRLAAAEALAQRHAEAGLGDDILFNLALAERRRGEPRRAIALIERIQKRPGDADLIRAAALADLGRLSDAIAILEAAAPRSIIAALNYGILLRRGEMLNDSVRVLRSLARVWTGAPIVDYHLARSLESSGDLRAARQYYLAAAEAETDPALSEVFRREAARMLALEAKP